MPSVWMACLVLQLQPYFFPLSCFLKSITCFLIKVHEKLLETYFCFPGQLEVSYAMP